jgi:hypothetical protein
MARHYYIPEHVILDILDGNRIYTGPQDKMENEIVWRFGVGPAANVKFGSVLWNDYDSDSNSPRLYQNLIQSLTCPVSRALGLAVLHSV